MLGKSISGSNACFVCGKEMHWETRIVGTRSNIVIQRIPDIAAEECAVGKTENGEVIFEIECVCPNCKTRNKYIVNRKM